MYKVLFVDVLNQFCLPFVLSISLFSSSLSVLVPSVPPGPRDSQPDELPGINVIAVRIGR